MIKEQELVDSVLKAMHSQAVDIGLPFHAIQIESGATAIGIPDLFVLIGDTSCWIECKRLISKEPDFVTDRIGHTHIVPFNGIVNYRPGQLIMLERFARHNQNAFTLCITQYMDVYFYKHDGKTKHADYGTLHVNKAKGITLPYALQSLCDHLHIDYSAYRDNAHNN